MKKIVIVGLIIIMLAVPNLIVSAENIERVNSPITPNDDVPIWNVGNSWTFQISEFTADYTYEALSIMMSGQINDFKWTVSDTSGSNYIVDVEGTVSATFDGVFPLGDNVINVNGEIKPNRNKISGTLILTKANLEIVDFDVVITGIANTQIHPLPFKLPLPIKITADATLSTAFPLFNFPLHVLKFWNLPDLDLEMATTFGGRFGLLSYPLTFYTSYAWTPLAFSVLVKETITVPAGTYDAWKVQSLIGDYFVYYYAAEVGNIIKIDVNMPRGGITGELSEFNYV